MAKKLCLVLVALLAITSTNAMAAVNVELRVEGSAVVNKPYDIGVYLIGTDTVTEVGMPVSFDKTKVEITAIGKPSTPAGIIVPGNVTKVNTDQLLKIAYSNLDGFVPGAEGTKMATLTCLSKSEATVTFNIDETATKINAGSTSVIGSLTDKAFPVVSNNPPVAVKNGNLAVLEDTDKTGKMEANDADGDTLTYSLSTTTTAQKGKVTLDSATGAYTYKPNPNINGDDVFGFSVTDGKATDTATIAVTIEPVNDPPVPDPNPLEITTDEDTEAKGFVTAADADKDTIAYSLAGQATSGVATVGADGAYTYKPKENFNGTDFFTFTADDKKGSTATGKVSVTVKPANDPPVAKAEDQKLLAAVLSIPASMTGTLIYNDADGDTLTVTVTQPTTGKIEITDPKTGAYKYTPTSPFPVALPAKDSFKFKVKDAALESAEVTVNMTIESGAHKLTVKKVLPDGGTVKPNGEVVVDDGKDQEFVVTVNYGYYVASARVVWADGTKKTFTVKDGKFTVPAVKQDGIVTLTFKEQYKIKMSVTPAAGGTVCEDSGRCVPYKFYIPGENGAYTEITDIETEFRVNGGVDLIITMSPANKGKGWMIDEVKIDGVVNETAAINGKYTFVKVDANHTVDVIFERTGEIHSGDADANNQISLLELQRVISLYNRNDGKYICDPYSEDGYASGDDATKRTCLPHDADFEPFVNKVSIPDWKIGLSELLRVIQFWSLNGYHRATLADEGFPTKDGFAPGK